MAKILAERHRRLSSADKTGTGGNCRPGDNTDGRGEVLRTTVTAAVCSEPPQAFPHFPRDIKESSSRRAIPKKIPGPGQLVDPCEAAGAIPYSRLSSEFASRHPFGSYHGRPGALLVPAFTTFSAVCWSRIFTPSASIPSAMPPLACCTAARWRSGRFGQGLAAARSLKPKHAIKQVDRLLSNPAINVDDILGPVIN